MGAFTPYEVFLKPDKRVVAQPKRLSVGVAEHGTCRLSEAPLSKSAKRRGEAAGPSLRLLRPQNEFKAYRMSPLTATLV
jgi:hypothetical protein